MENKERSPITNIIYMALTLFVVMYGANLISQIYQSDNIAERTDVALAAVNTGINGARREIDSLRTTIPQRVSDSLSRHPEYKYIQDAQPYMDSLAQANEKLLDRAYRAVDDYAVFSVLYRGEKLFNQYPENPIVQDSKWRYYKNKRQIQAFNKTKDGLASLPESVRRDITDKTLSDIQRLQSRIDSMLNLKDSLINTKVR